MVCILILVVFFLFLQLKIGSIWLDYEDKPIPASLYEDKPARPSLVSMATSSSNASTSQITNVPSLFSTTSEVSSFAASLISRSDISSKEELTSSTAERELEAGDANGESNQPSRPIFMGPLPTLDEQPTTRLQRPKYPSLPAPTSQNDHELPDILFARHLKHFTPSRYGAGTSFCGLCSIPLVFRKPPGRRTVTTIPALGRTGERKVTPIPPFREPSSGSFLPEGPPRRMLPYLIPTVVFEEDDAALRAFNREVSREDTTGDRKRKKQIPVLPFFRASISNVATAWRSFRIRR